MKSFLGILLAISAIGCQSTSKKPIGPTKPIPSGFVRLEFRVKVFKDKPDVRYFACVPAGWNQGKREFEHVTTSEFLKNERGEELTVTYGPNLPKDMWDYMLEKPGPDLVNKTSTIRRRAVTHNGWAGQTEETHLHSGKKFFDRDGLVILLTNKRDAIVVEIVSKDGKPSLSFDDLWKIVDSIEPE